MYEFRVLNKKGNFEIFNIRRKKVVFKGTDRQLSKRANKTYEFGSREDLIRSLSGWLSIATYRKVNSVLTPDDALLK